MAHKLAIHFIRSHNASHNVIIGCISSTKIVNFEHPYQVRTSNSAYSIALLPSEQLKSVSHESKTIMTMLVN